MTNAQLMAAMDVIISTLLLALIAGLNFVSVLGLPRPENLEVEILEGEVTAFWQDPAGSPGHPSNFKYNVQMAKHGEKWAVVQNCTGITQTYCELSSLIDNYRTMYRVKVQLVAGVNQSAWLFKTFLPNIGKLRPPLFNVYVTSSSLTVNVVQNPFLKTLFPYGLMYTIILEERENNNMNITAYLIDDKDEDLSPKTFEFLHWGKEYCVSVKVEGLGSLDPSRASKQCLQLPEEEWYQTAVASQSALGVLGLIAVVATIMLCYLKRPAKTPVALKSPLSDWRPMSVAEGTMEVVTDKGWFLSSYTTQDEAHAKAPLTNLTMTEESDEEDRRTSMDSGVSMETNSIETHQERPSISRQDDSGCGSLGGQEISTSDQTTYPPQKDGSKMDIASEKGDSGMGCGFQFHSSPLTVKQQHSEPLKEAVYGGNYRSQTPRNVEIDICDDKVELPEMLDKPSLAEVIQGYRAGLQSCICSGAGECTWCDKNVPRATHITRQRKATYAENTLPNRKCNSTDAFKGIPVSIFPKDTQIDSVSVNDLVPFPQLQETFPLLSAFTSLPPMDGGQDHNMNNLPLSLCDVQLIID